MNFFVVTRNFRFADPINQTMKELTGLFLLMALTATRPFARALRRHAIGGVAMRANDVNGVAHGAFLTEKVVDPLHGAAGPETKEPVDHRVRVSHGGHRRCPLSGETCRVPALTQA